MYSVLRRAAMTKFVTFGVRFCLQSGLQVQLFNTYGQYSTYLRAARSNFVTVCQGKRVTCIFIQNPGGFRPTKRLNLGIYQKRQVVSAKTLSRPVPVFMEFKYSVIYGKMFFQQEITDAEVSTSYADC